MCNNLPNYYQFCVMIVQTLHSMLKDGKNMHQLWQKQKLSHYFWVKFQSNLRCFLKNLHDWQKFYTTAGRTGRAKYQLWKYKNTIDSIPKYKILATTAEVLDKNMKTTTLQIYSKPLKLQAILCKKKLLNSGGSKLDKNSLARTWKQLFLNHELHVTPAAETLKF